MPFSKQSSSNFFALAFVVLTFSISFQNCGRFVVDPQSIMNQANNIDNSSRLALAPQFSFSQGFEFPTSKQGVGEHEYFLGIPIEVKQARNIKLNQWGVKYKQYNVWWSKLENTASSTTPVSCPAGTVLVPDNENARVVLGYNKFHCYNKSELEKYDFIFSMNHRNGVQSGVVLWSSPQIYQYPQCQGFNFGGNLNKEGCVPRDDAMDDFEDYVNLLASRYNGGSSGKISHFIIWNENSSPDWFDYTPNVSKSDRSEAAIDKRINKYVDLLKRSHQALQRHQQSSLMYVSTDQLWGPWIHEGNFGVKRLLDGIWEKLGVNYSWSVAVHPYGNVQDHPGNNIYSFNNLEIVADYQKSQLLKRGVNQPLNYPQSLLIASEQGWGFDPMNAQSRNHQAQQLCLAHQKVKTMDQVVAVAHNYFHSVESNENQSGSQSGQGSFFGLIPFKIPADLSGTENIVTGQAYISTFNSEIWGKSSEHYCCQKHQVGCLKNDDVIKPPSPTPTPVFSPSPSNPPLEVNKNKVMGVIDFVKAEGLQVKMQGWACMEEVSKSIKVHLYVGESTNQMSLIGEYDAQATTENAINLSCKTSGSSHRFIITLNHNQSNQFHGLKIFIFGISQVGKSNNLLNRSGEFEIPLIIANTPTPSPVVTPTPTLIPSPSPSLQPTLLPVSPTPTVTPLNYRQVDIFRFRKGKDYLYTTQQSEGINAGYSFEGLVFKLVDQSISGKSKAIYRCYLPDDHFFSSDSRCEGASVDGLIGYVLIQQESATRPLYRYYKSSTGQHLITTHPEEATQNGFSLDGILGYVY